MTCSPLVSVLRNPKKSLKTNNKLAASAAKTTATPPMSNGRFKASSRDHWPLTSTVVRLMSRRNGATGLLKWGSYTPRGSRSRGAYKCN